MNPSEKNRASKESLLLKYNTGNINKEEMHLLNQYALDDDFLFEALEGLSKTEGENGTALVDLSNRLKQKRKKRKPIYLYWMSAAASIAILLFAVNFFSPNKNEAFNAPMVMEESTANDAVSKTDKAIPQEELEAENTVTSTNQNSRGIENKSKRDRPQNPAKNFEADIASNSIPAPPPPPEKLITPEPSNFNLDLESESIEEIALADEVTQELIRNPKAGTKEIISSEDIGNEELGDVSSDAFRSESKIAAPIASNALRSPSKKLARERTAKLPTIKLSGSVRSQDGEPIIGAYIYSAWDEIGTYSNSEGAFILELDPTERRIQISATGFNRLEYDVKEMESLELVLEKKDSNAIEVIFLDDEGQDDNDNIDLLEFQKYLNRNFEFPVGIDEQERIGFVTIEFDINKRGKSENITLLDSMGNGTDEEVVQLVEKYAQWSDNSGVSRMKIRLLFKGKR